MMSLHFFIYLISYILLLISELIIILTIYLADGGQTNKLYFIIPTVALSIFDIFLLTPMTLFFFVSLLVGNHIINSNGKWDDTTMIGKFGRYLHVAVPFMFPVSAICIYIVFNFEFAIRVIDNFDVLFVAFWIFIAIIITGVSRWLPIGRQRGADSVKSMIGPGISVIAYIFAYLVYTQQGVSWTATGGSPKYLYLYQFDYIMLVWVLVSLLISIIILISYYISKRND